MDQAATVALILLGLIVFNNFRRGTLGAWFRAKFLNQAENATPGASGASGLGGAGSSGGGAGGGGVASWASLRVPVAGVVTSALGDDRPGGRSHAGTDVAAAVGTPVRAAAAGRVIWAGPAGGYGLLVKIDHGGGMETRYAHLSRIVVGVGQHVAAGDVVGYVGTTGVATGPHLHFEVRQWGVPVDASGLWRQEVVA